MTQNLCHTTKTLPNDRLTELLREDSTDNMHEHVTIEVFSHESLVR